MSYLTKSSRFLMLLRRHPKLQTLCRLLSDDAAKANVSRNPYYSKYAHKIKELEQRDPEEIERRLAAAKAGPSTSPTSNPQPEAQPKQPSYTKPKPLDPDTILQLRGKTTAELTETWKKLHSNKDAVCAVLPSAVYERIHERALEFPVFLFPLPRENGYEFVLSQFLGDQCHMTPLAAYQRYASEAPPCLSLTFRTELAPEQGVTLMSGEYDPTLLGPAQAQCLVNQLQLYYGGSELKKKLLLWNFNREPLSFKHEELVREFERSLAGSGD
ncbi:unnamed protein product [Ixodes hexagonus]